MKNGKKPNFLKKRKNKNAQRTLIKNYLDQGIEIYTGAWRGEICNFVHCVVSWETKEGPQKVRTPFRDYKDGYLVPAVKVMFGNNTYILLDNSENYAVNALWSGTDEGCTKYGRLVTGEVKEIYSDARTVVIYINVFAPSFQRIEFPEMFWTEEELMESAGKTNDELYEEFIANKDYKRLTKDEEE